MNIMTRVRVSCAVVLAAGLTLGTGQNASAALSQVVGQLVGNGSAQVDSAGLTVTVKKGQQYVVFAGDTIKTRVAGDVKLQLNSVGVLTLAPDTELELNGDGSSYQVELKKGQLAYALNADANIRLQTAQGELRPDGQSGTLMEGAIASLDQEVYVLGQAGSASAYLTDIGSGEEHRVQAGDLVYSGPAKRARIPLFAQLGAPESVSSPASNNQNVVAVSSDDVWNDNGVSAVIVSNPEVTEGEDLIFKVRLREPAEQPVELTFVTRDVTAQSNDDSGAAPFDYQGRTVTVRFEPGETIKAVTVPTFADSLVEPEETLELVLQEYRGIDAANTPEGIGTIDAGQAVLWAGICGPIGAAAGTGDENEYNDDDESAVLISNPEVGEGGHLVFKVKLRQPSTQPVVLRLRTADDSALSSSDYSARDITLNYQPGETLKHVRIQALEDDEDDEPPETLTLSVISAQGLAANDTPPGIGTITDGEAIGAFVPNPTCVALVTLAGVTATGVIISVLEDDEESPASPISP